MFHATHASIRTSGRSTAPRETASLRPERSPTAPGPFGPEARSFGARLEPRYIVGAGSLDQ